jgi:hypothetical protein
MSRYEDFQTAIKKRVNKFTVHPNWQTELQAISTALDSDTTLHDQTIVARQPALTIGPDKTPFQNQILHVVNKGFAGNIPPSDMADGINSVLGIALPPGRIDLPYASGGEDPTNTVHCTSGNWTNSPTSYAYQWLSGPLGGTPTTPIAAGTTADYPFTAAEDDHTLLCRVTAVNAAGSAESDSNTVDCFLFGSDGKKRHAKNSR